MKFLKPSWVHHEANNPIFSIDIHPDGSRFATGGQGDDNGKIIIWNMQPIRDSLKELDDNSPKILCQMDHHLSCVNCVRWSNNGNYLASGSDDKLIMIWQYSSTTSYQNLENWKCSFTLRGHEGDVLDLAWSTKDNYLASASVDNTIIVWNALKFPEIIKRIEAHNGLVKGICWDPAEKYLASQSDDRTLKIWRTSDWGLEKCIEEPFKGCAGTTHILRLNWSPDANCVVSAHAMNNGMPTAQIIERNGWKTKLDFVGHEKAVTVVRFYPQILKQNKEDQDKFYCLCAVGSRDHSLSVWLTQYQRPITVMHDLFTNPIMDISWLKHPIGLLCCSYDGTIAYFEFNNEEIGYPLSQKELETFFKTNYSVDLNERPVRSTQLTDKPKFIENIDVLLAQESKENTEPVAKCISIGSQSAVSTRRSSIVENQTQVERKLPDGRRRITPICIAKAGDFEQPKPFGLQQVDIQLKSQTATELSKIIVEKRDEKNEIVERSPIKSIQYQNTNSCSQDHFQYMNQIKEQQEKMKITSTNESNQQVNQESQLNLVTSVTSTPSTITSTSLTTTLTTTNTTNSIKKATPTVVQIKQANVPTTSTVSANGPMKPSQPSLPIKPPIQKKPQPVPQPISQSQKLIEQSTNGNVEIQHRYSIQLKELKLEQNRTSRKIVSNKTEYTIEIENFLNNNKNLHQFRLCEKSTLKWSYLFNQPIQSISHSSHIISIFTQERLVYFLNISNGTLICSPILLDDYLAAHKASQNQNYFLCLTTNGYLYLWQYSLQNVTIRTLLSQLSCELLFKNNDDITLLNCKLTDSGIPIIYMSNNQVFYYSIEFKCWHLLPNQNSLSQSFITNSSNTNESSGLLSMHQIKDTNNELIRTIERFNTSDDIKHDFTMRHLESQMNAALSFNSHKEYKFWLMTYVRYLSENVYEDKLKDMCNFLLGPSHSLDWNSHIMIYHKHELLKEVLAIIRKSIELQRLYSLYKQQLDAKNDTNQMQID